MQRVLALSEIICFSYERMGTKTRFEREAKGNPERPIPQEIFKGKKSEVDNHCCNFTLAVTGRVDLQ